MPSQRKGSISVYPDQRTEADRKAALKQRRKSRVKEKDLVAIRDEDDVPLQQLNPWEAFQEHLRSIDDSSAMYTSRDAGTATRASELKVPDAKSGEESGPVDTAVAAEQQSQKLMSTVKCQDSDVFQKVMYEFQLRRQQHLDKMAAIQKEKELRAQKEAAGEQKDEPENGEEEEEEDSLDSDWSDEEEVDTFAVNAAAQLRKTATRAWGIIRRHVDEKTMENKQKGSAMNWNFLRQTIAHMTDMEKGRQNLYERYLYKPNSWKEGFINFPEEVIEHDRNKGRKSYRPQKTKKIKA